MLNAVRSSHPAPRSSHAQTGHTALPPTFWNSIWTPALRTDDKNASPSDRSVQSPVSIRWTASLPGWRLQSAPYKLLSFRSLLRHESDRFSAQAFSHSAGLPLPPAAAWDLRLSLVPFLSDPVPDCDKYAPVPPLTHTVLPMYELRKRIHLTFP